MAMLNNQRLIHRKKGVQMGHQHHTHGDDAHQCADRSGRIFYYYIIWYPMYIYIILYIYIMYNYNILYNIYT